MIRNTSFTSLYEKGQKAQECIEKIKNAKSDSNRDPNDGKVLTEQENEDFKEINKLLREPYTAALTVLAENVVTVAQKAHDNWDTWWSEIKRIENMDQGSIKDNTIKDILEPMFGIPQGMAPLIWDEMFMRMEDSAFPKDQILEDFVNEEGREIIVNYAKQVVGMVQNWCSKASEIINDKKEGESRSPGFRK